MSARAPRLNWFAAMLVGGSPLVSMALRLAAELSVRRGSSVTRITGMPQKRARFLNRPTGALALAFTLPRSLMGVYRLTDDPSRSTVHYRTGFVSSVRAGPAVACRPGIVGDEQPRSVGLRLSNELGGERAWPAAITFAIRPSGAWIS
jgi:hypothetical protein